METTTIVSAEHSPKNLRTNDVGLRTVLILAGLGLVVTLLVGVPLSAEDSAATARAGKPGDGLIALNPNRSVLLDREGKRLLVKTHVVLREGMLEMLCCPIQTKEHEAIVAVDARASVIHAGLIALGAKPGTPVQYRPEFKPPSGQPIDIFLQWTDPQGKPHRARAQEWIRYATHRMYVAPFETLPAGLKLPERDDDLPIRFLAKFKELTWFGPMSAAQRDKLLSLSQDEAYQKAIRKFFTEGRSRQLDVGWVFAGSGFYVDPQTGEKSYLAEGGDLICVSNFPSAMLDLSVKSTDKEAEGLMFEPWTDAFRRGGPRSRWN